MFKTGSSQSFRMLGFDSISNSESIKIFDATSASKLKQRSSIKRDSKLGRSSKVESVGKVESVVNESSSKLSSHRISMNSIIGIFNR